MLIKIQSLNRQQAVGSLGISDDSNLLAVRQIYLLAIHY